MNAYAPTGSTVDMSSINTPIAPALATSTVADEPATTTTVAAASTPAQPDTTVPTQPPASASTTTSSITDIMKSLFTQTNMYIVLGFFAGYFVLYTVLGKFFNQPLTSYFSSYLVRLCIFFTINIRQIRIQTFLRI
jgi:hypothetical protein